MSKNKSRRRACVTKYFGGHAQRHTRRIRALLTVGRGSDGVFGKPKNVQVLQA